jgi:hypothetical protein
MISPSRSAAWLCALFALVACGDSASQATERDAGGESDGDAGSALQDATVIECSHNAGCADSAAALVRDNLKCLTPELYCREGHCVADCADICTVARTDVNPCEKGICARSPNENIDLNFCTMLPVACKAESDCPKYLPRTADGGSASWTCQDGVCAYPDFVYSTQ